MAMERMERDREGSWGKVGDGGCQDCRHSIGMGQFLSKRLKTYHWYLYSLSSIKANKTQIIRPIH